MKNIAVKAMIRYQFNWVEESDVSVEFLSSVGLEEEYRVTVMDDGVFKEFKLKVEMEEVK